MSFVKRLKGKFWYARLRKRHNFSSTGAISTIYNFISTPRRTVNKLLKKQGFIFYKFIRKICHVFSKTKTRGRKRNKKKTKGKTCRLKRDEENVINLSFLIVWCFLSLSHLGEENFSYQLIILIVNKTNFIKSLNSSNASLSCFKFVSLLRGFSSQNTGISIIRLQLFSHRYPLLCYLFRLQSGIIFLKEMNVIKGDFHQSEIWYV